MAVGAEIPEVDPAAVRTRGMGAAVTGRIDLAATPTSASESGWRRAGQLRMRRNCLLTALALRLAPISGQWFGFTLAPRRFRRRRRQRAAAPTPMGQENQEDEEYTGDEIESQVGSHPQPLRLGDR
jgi:hypothetical protein